MFEWCKSINPSEIEHPKSEIKNQNSCNLIKNEVVIACKYTVGGVQQFD